MTARLLSSRATVSDTRTFADSLLFEIKFALRTLLRDRSYAAASVVMLALALTLNTTVYTVMDAVLFRGFPSPWYALATDLLIAAAVIVTYRSSDRRFSTPESSAQPAESHML